MESRRFQRPLLSNAQTKQLAIVTDVGVQVVGTRDTSVDSSPITFTQGTSTQLDETSMDFNNTDPKLEIIKQNQQQLIERLDHMQDIVQGTYSGNNTGPQQEKCIAYLVKDEENNYILISDNIEESEAPESIQTTYVSSQTGTISRQMSEAIRSPPATLNINELETNNKQILKRMYTKFYAGQIVMVDLREDGWFYVAEILQNNGSENYLIGVKVNNDQILAPSHKILPSSTTEFQRLDLLSEQYVLAEHPYFSSCYAPGIITQVEKEQAKVYVEFYDGFKISVAWSAVQPIDRSVYSVLQSNALQYDDKWITQEVVSRRDKNGIFYSSRIVGKSWITRYFIVKFDDGSLQEQSLMYIFKINEAPTMMDIQEGSYVLASGEAGLYMPGCVTTVELEDENQVHVRMCHGEDWTVMKSDVILITEAYYTDLYAYISKVSDE